MKLKLLFKPLFLNSLIVLCLYVHSTAQDPQRPLDARAAEVYYGVGSAAGPEIQMRRDSNGHDFPVDFVYRVLLRLSPNYAQFNPNQVEWLKTWIQEIRTEPRTQCSKIQVSAGESRPGRSDEYALQLASIYLSRSILALDSLGYKGWIDSARHLLSKVPEKWKDPNGPWIELSLIRKSCPRSAEEVDFKVIYPMVYKPALYLYPPEATPVRAQIHYDGILTHLHPKPGIQGWDVVALPNGQLIDQASSNPKDTVGYLFWEGTRRDAQYDLSQGSCLPKDSLSIWLNMRLKEAQLSGRERQDFLTYWIPKLSIGPMIQVHLADSSEYDAYARWTIIPKPTIFNRIFVVFTQSKTCPNMTPQSWKKALRQGFTAIEWGGTLNESIEP